MKKTYIKPQIMFESFSVSESIAGTCERIVGNPLEGSCAYHYVDEFGDENNVFSDLVAACTTKWQTDEIDGFCYHVPYDTSDLFNS